MTCLRIAAVVCVATLITSNSPAWGQKPSEEEPGKTAPTPAEATGSATVQGIDALRPLAKDGDAAVRTSALLALADLQDGKTIHEALADKQLPSEIRAALVDRLLESIGGALILLRLFDAEQVAPEAKVAVLAKIAAHPDLIVRSLFEKFIPEDQRPKKLAAATSAENILKLSADAERGEKIFSQSAPSQSFAAQCKTCHAVRGVGGDIGPDLSVIGHKLDRAALLQAMLEPSKSVAPEFVPYLLETSAGQFYSGYLVEKTDKEVVFKDFKNQTIRVPAAEVSSLNARQRSLMPDLTLRDGAAQDAADLLAYLTSLRNNDQPVTAFRVLGPFDSSKTKLDKALDPEKSQKSLAAPDLAASYKGVDGAELHWELAPTNNSLGFPAIDTAKYDAGRKLRSTDVTHYLLVTAESPAAQTVALLLGAEGGCKVWVNGQLAHCRETEHGLASGAERFTTRFKTGRNVILIKLKNDSGPGGVKLALHGQEPLELKTE